MFKVVSDRTFTHDVDVQTPVNGGYEKSTIKVTYNFLPADEVDSTSLRTGTGTAEFLRRAVRKVEGIADEEGNPLPYNDALRETLIALVDTRFAMCRGYFAAIEKASEGN